MPPFRQRVTRSTTNWRAAIANREFTDEASYTKALEQLQNAERNRAFDGQVAQQATKIENEAAAIVKKIRAYDWERTYGPPVDKDGQQTGKRTEGEHFLGNVDLINSTLLMQVAKKMPKGAHLHIHWNSCLPARFLIEQARDVEAMYIRSTLPLTSPKNMAESRISFMVLTKQEAMPLGDVWDANYVSNRWMPYKQFQQRFHVEDENGTTLMGTSGAETWLESKMIIHESEAYSVHQTGRGIWEKFNHRTQMMKGLFAYESAFRNYTRACIRDFVKDNIQYAEIRPNFMANNSLKTDDGTGSIGNEGILKIINEELQTTMNELSKQGEFFGGLKVIYCTPRSFKREQIAASLDECIGLKKKYMNLICGFDLVGHEEMGNELRHFVPEFLEFRKVCKAQGLDIPFLFHCGETLGVGTVVDGNLFDAILLNSKRIGHGYAAARHPLIMDLLKEKNIAIESCPISNEVLGLTPVTAGHHLPILLANDVPCTINSDNATFYRSSLSHDFYQVMIGSESMSLHGWKQLAKWSLEHSCMDPGQRENVTVEWERRWQEYCQWIVDAYGPTNPDLGNWQPTVVRH